MIRYQLALLAHSQRFLLPSIAYVAFLGLLYNGEANSPVLPEYALSAGALAIFACWLTIALVDAEDPVRSLITRAHARRLSIVVGGIVVTVLACCGALILISLVLSAITHGGVPFGELIFGMLAHIACASTGTAIGLASSRMVVSQTGLTVVVAPVALAVVLLVRWIPLANPMLRALAANDPDASPLVLGILTSLLALAAGAAAVTYVAERRG